MRQSGPGTASSSVSQSNKGKERRDGRGEERRECNMKDRQREEGRIDYDGEEERRGEERRGR